jgi:hypothetical protein
MDSRRARILVGIVSVIALSPVFGMVLAFAIVPALPIVLAIAIVLGSIDWVEARSTEGEVPEEGALPHPATSTA